MCATLRPPNPKVLKNNPGTRSVSITCAIGNGKVLMWHQVPGRWNAATASAMYSGPLARCLQREYPGVRGSWRVLEDNDPTGYKCRAALAAKRGAGIQTLDLPQRSPDLNPLDFAFWAHLNKRMRAQEKRWSETKREGENKYIARLRRTALSTPPDFIRRIVGSLHKRCSQLEAAQGGHFTAGG